MPDWQRFIHPKQNMRAPRGANIALCDAEEYIETMHSAFEYKANC